jgi:fumarate reductase flavoprotein subunit
MARSPWHEEADLIVVGGSVGGLTAAITAADKRCRVIVVEHAKELGGGAGAEPEAIAAPGSRFQQAAGIADTPARLVDDVQAASRHHVEAELVAALAEQGAPVVAWLADRCGSGVELLPGQVGGGHSVARLHGPGERGGASLVADLVRAVTRHSHITVRLGAIVERLVRDDAGPVRGLAIRADRRGSSHALAGSVLLATGGFVASDELVAAHGPDVAALPPAGPALAIGDGLRLALEAGAQTRRLGAFLLTPFLAMPAQLTVTAPLVDLGAILVSQAGRRFADETAECLPLATTVRAQPGHVAYLLFDDRIAAAASAMDPFFHHVILPRTGRRGATLADLAKQFELDVNGLSLTLDTFNANLDLGGDPFGRERFDGRLEPPFHAIRVTGARLHTLGGLAVDAHARVLGAGGQPIEGLYAAGGTAAGLAGDGTEGALPGTTALAALGLGRLAALDVIARTAAPADEP